MKERKRKAVVIVGIVIVISILAVIMGLSITGKMTIISISRNDNQENEKPEALVDPDNWDTSRVTVYTDPVSGKKAPIPKGYSVSQVEGETGIDTGLVIYEGETPVTGTAEYSTDENSAWVQSCKRNQWVWVPCPDPSRIYEEDSATGKKTGKLYSYTSTGRNSESSEYEEPAALTCGEFDNEYYFGQFSMFGKTKERMQNELESEYEATIESIKKYGGFYIGRYETGNGYNSKPVVQRMNDETDGIWYEMYDKMDYLRANKNVKTNIIFGSLWDETLQWLVDSGAKDSSGNVIGYTGMYDSTGWGNYYNSEFDYRNASGSEVHKSSYTMIPKGSTEYTKANNIYDMAGNEWEWTLEAKSGYNTILEANVTFNRVLRGGDCYNGGGDNPASNRVFDGPYADFGARAYLYIK